MSVVSTLRQLRHGPLKRFGPAWTTLGGLYRAGIQTFGGSRPVDHRIGGYGPFLLQGEFAFSDFENWGGAHNRGFRYCIEACRGKHCVLDVGAHIGLVALPMSRVVGDRGRVYAFEPAAANLAALRAHMGLNKIDNVTVIEALVGATERKSMQFFEQPRAAGQNAVVIKKNPELYGETQRQQVTLDGYCQTHGLAPEVIKIDVEGGEMGVLEGARGVLSAHRPLVVLSVHPTELGLLGCAPEELPSLIAELGYACRDIDGNPVNTFELDEYILEPIS